MQYLILFLEGTVTFISPCLLPMLPIYVSYFAGQEPGVTPGGDSGTGRRPVLVNALGFVLGFTLVFMALGAFAGTLGSLLREHSLAVNLVSGLIVILFGLNYLEIIRIPLLSASRQHNLARAPVGFFAALLFGVIFSVGWTPCVGAFLGSALAMAAAGGDRLRGILMLLCFSLGLGIPFVASAMLIDRLKTAFAFIKQHYRLVTRLSGGLLVLVGILMMTGLMNRFIAFLTPA